MEVHHHSHHPKKWKEYLTEFVMLFAAVTLGFFAENQREHFVERHREKQYLESLMDDLAKDKQEMLFARKYTANQIAGLDTAIELLSKGNWSAENIKTMYRVSLKTGGTRPITFIDRTSSQLRSGGMRLIEDKNISNLITEYWQLIAQLNEFENVTIYQYKLNIKNLTYKIIDGTKYIDVKNKVINDDATLLTYDNVILKEYNNRLINLKFDINAYIVNYFYDRIDKKIEELQKEISSKYEIKVVKEVAEKF
jgi:hypothetical protein